MRPITILVTFLALSAHSRETTPEEAQVIDFWNDAAAVLCQEFPKYGIDQWPDFQQRQLILYGATRERRTNTLRCVFVDQSDQVTYFAFLGVRIRASLASGCAPKGSCRSHPLTKPPINKLNSPCPLSAAGPPAKLPRSNASRNKRIPFSDTSANPCDRGEPANSGKDTVSSRVKHSPSATSTWRLRDLNERPTSANPEAINSIFAGARECPDFSSADQMRLTVVTGSRYSPSPDPFANSGTLHARGVRSDLQQGPRPVKAERCEFLASQREDS